VTPLIANDRPYTIRVRYPQQNRNSLEAMSSVVINSASGRTATLGSLAALTEVENPGQTEVRRENLQRMVAVTARLENRDMGSGIRDVQKAVAGPAPAARDPRRIRRHLPGTAEVVPRSAAGAGAGRGAGLHRAALRVPRLRGARAILLGAAFDLGRSSRCWSRAPFNIASFMGLIMVIGIVAKNGILLLDADQKFRSMGMDAEVAMVQAGRRRLRPILMTALATVAGMLPLSLGLGAGSQMLQPLAIAVIGGILISMALSLIITPAIHFYLTRKDENGFTTEARSH
jgi:multidrug efflux pump subunit AcrB